VTEQELREHLPCALSAVGTFFSQVYGRVIITPQDLMTMFRNFKTVTPLSPTQLPIDYDHLSDEPAKPVDGKAAGWVQDLQVRDGGQTMWCLPKWTRRAAELIANGEYRFVSPYFLVDYLDKASGQRIGPTLKAVAITNRPFLEGMETDPGAADVGWKRDATNTPQLQWMPARRQMSHFYWRPLPLFDQLRLLCPPCTPLIEPLERWAYLHAERVGENIFHGASTVDASAFVRDTSDGSQIVPAGNQR